MSISNGSSQGVSKNLTIVKQYFKKPMTLVIGILSLITIVSQIMMSSSLNKILPDITAMMGTEDTISFNTNNTFSYILSGVITLSIFMIFLSSLTPSGGPTIWFSILHILSVIQLLLTAIGALLVVVLEIVFIFSTPTIVNYMVNNGIAGLGEMPEEAIDQISRSVSSFRTSLIIGLIITIVIYAIVLYFINSQTAFLKSVTLTCKNPQLKSKGAVPYGNLSIFIGVVELVVIVIYYLLVGNASTNLMSDMDLESSVALPDMTSVMMPMMIYGITNALYIILRGYFCKGWAKFAKENEQYVYEAVGASTRVSDQSPIPTYKSTARHSTEARQQSQPYLIGEEEDKNKKSSYIPEELQNEFDDNQMYGQGGQPYGGNDMYGGNPYGGQPQPFPGQGGNPYGDPFAQSPMGGNPYGGQPQGGGNPYGGGYNNGMM